MRSPCAAPSADGLSSRTATFACPRERCVRTQSRICGSHFASEAGVRKLMLRWRWLTVRISTRSVPAAVSRSASPNPVMLRIIGPP